MRKKRRLNRTLKILTFIQILGLFLIVFSLVYWYHYTSRVDERSYRINQAKIEYIKDVKKGKKKFVGKLSKLSNKSKANTIGNNLESIEDGSDAIHESNSNYSNAIGFVEIKKLKVTLPIFVGTSKQELRDGVGIVESTDYPSDEERNVSVLAGHRGGYNGKQTFLNIHKLKKGDLITVLVGEKQLVYKVVGQEIIASDDWSKFTRENGKSKLMLISCHPYPQNYERILIKSELLRTVKLEEVN